ncbi:MAG: glycosyltransferase family 2 protein [Rhodospirillales bacterium]|jgi:glycosyltransferase involved in cell wall biosynthesis|nr:glycosyltransferase family 2 protein [Rhodospirillales bacterium]
MLAISPLRRTDVTDRLAAGAFRVAVVIPCYRVREQVADVVDAIGPEIDLIYVVDDACPEHSGEHLLARCADPRVQVLVHEANQGVGGAVITGYRQALADGAEIVVKLDGDGQMAPALIPRLVAPIMEGRADYTKGNRFWNLEDAGTMPPARMAGNIALSFLTKLSSGYWGVFDPTNGFTAIHAAVLRELPLNKIARRYFFESDMLFRIGILRGLVVDVPMTAVYHDAPSSLRIGRVLLPFFARNMFNTAKRILYRYFLRDFSIASIQLLAGLALLSFGTVFGIREWSISTESGVVASTGTVMLAALPVILGVQLLLSFLSFDVAGTPARAVHPLLETPRFTAVTRRKP